MPLTPYLKEAVFSPKDIEALNTAFTMLCKTFDLTDPNHPRGETIARELIEIARTGERDPERLHDLVVLAVEARDQRSA